MKVIMVLSFIGALAFVGIAIITNQGITFESYNYISKKSVDTKFEEMQDDIYTNVKKYHGASSNDYTDFLVNANKELNDGISFFLNYLSIEEALQKNEHNILISAYDNYLSKFQSVQTAYKDYMKAYNAFADLNAENPIYAQTLLKNKEFIVSSAYADCFKSGSAFFKELVNTVKSYSFSGAFLPYSCQRYLIKVGLCDYVVKQVFTPTRDEININLNSLKIIFDNYCANADGFSDRETITNSNFLKFTTTLNAVNIYEWAGNFNSYVLTLSPSLATEAQAAKIFFNEGYLQ